MPSMDGRKYMKDERSQNKGWRRESFMWGHRGGSHALPPRVVMEKKTFAFGLERQAGSRCPITCHLKHICLAINKLIFLKAA